MLAWCLAWQARTKPRGGGRRLAGVKGGRGHGPVAALSRPGPASSLGLESCREKLRRSLAWSNVRLVDALADGSGRGLNLTNARSSV